MTRSSRSLRVLGPADVGASLELIATDPVVNVFAEYRTRITQLDPRWLGGEMWGWFEDDQLVSMLHVGANLVPVSATPAACEAFAARAGTSSLRSSTVVGPAETVAMLWRGLEDSWPAPRELRWDQPHMVTSRAPDIAADPLVRRTTREEVDLLYPACVAMYTEEVGVSPELDGGGDLYRARVKQLVGRGWSFSRMDGDRVLFKAEVACATPHACQVQGVYVDPEFRGRGLAGAGMAAVVEICLREIAPSVSLYVNGHNLSARAAYRRAGFEQVGTFSTIMF